jgi:hypothetical protein
VKRYLGKMGIDIPDATKPLGASRHEFEIFVICDRRLDEQVSETFRFGNHNASPELSDIPVVRIAHRVMNGFYFRKFTV